MLWACMHYMYVYYADMGQQSIAALVTGGDQYLKQTPDTVMLLPA